MKKVYAFLFFFLASMFLFLQTAFAYIDPSAMTYLITALSAVVIAVGTAIGFYWRRIVRFFRKKGKKNGMDDDEDDDDDEDEDDE